MISGRTSYRPDWFETLPGRPTGGRRSHTTRWVRSPGNRHHREFAAEMGQLLGVEPLHALTTRFSNDCLQSSSGRAAGGAGDPVRAVGFFSGYRWPPDPSSGSPDGTVVIDRIVGDVHGRDVIVLNDEMATAGAIVELLNKLRTEGVRQISRVCTHGLFTGPAIE